MIALEQKPASVLISVVGPGAVVVVNKAGGRYYKDENGSLGSLRAFTKKTISSQTWNSSNVLHQPDSKSLKFYPIKARN